MNKLNYTKPENNDSQETQQAEQQATTPHIGLTAAGSSAVLVDPK